MKTTVRRVAEDWSTGHADLVARFCAACGRAPGPLTFPARLGDQACRALVGAVVLLCSLGSLPAHELNTSYTDINLHPHNRALSCTLILDVTDLDLIFDLDANGDGEITRDEIQVKIDEMRDTLYPKVHLSVAGEELLLEKQRPLLSEDGLGNTFVKFNFGQTLERIPWRFVLRLEVFDDLGPRHKNLVKVTRGSETLQAILTVDYREQAFSFAGDAGAVFEQSLQFVWLGMEHIFIGYDHILFLLGLILIGGSLLNLVKMVSAFTVAHSITLILAVLQVVTLPSKLVESVIALSIVYIAAENFFVRKNDQRWLIAFVFGLMHGFGFAGVLTELGLPTNGLVASLLSFNVGVEIGQVTIVAACFPVILWIAKSHWQRQIVYSLSSLILFFGLVWFVERALNLELSFL
ncbi:MAG: HupE/UreJ family protein [bacterium]